MYGSKHEKTCARHAMQRIFSIYIMNILVRILTVLSILEYPKAIIIKTFFYILFFLV